MRPHITKAGGRFGQVLALPSQRLGGAVSVVTQVRANQPPMCPGPKGAPGPVGPAWVALAPVFEPPPLDVPPPLDPPLLDVPLPDPGSETTVEAD
jgi:hypothetical protein